jgi:mannose-6-phosphate isomerase-like protein (cupin superfamily)
MEEIITDNLDASIEEYQRRGYRLDMIFPADNPREALMSRAGEEIHLLPRSARSKGIDSDDRSPYSVRASATGDWTVGRAGMLYRDLTPAHLRGKVIASHIRVAHNGDVSDHVHYHKIRVQMINCVRGRIKVVYQDQGPPFWLETGDCILQPPEIRHRVLESTAGAEVIEVTVPAEHETWIDHEIELPTGRVLPDREFGGQRFVRHVAVQGGVECETGIRLATKGLAKVCVDRSLEVSTSKDSGFEDLVFPLDDGKYLKVSLSRELVSIS